VVQGPKTLTTSKGVVSMTTLAASKLCVKSFVDESSSFTKSVQ
jgi:hypothetical protein